MQVSVSEEDAARRNTISTLWCSGGLPTDSHVGMRFSYYNKYLYENISSVLSSGYKANLVLGIIEK